AVRPALLAAGAKVRAHDPEGLDEARKLLTEVAFCDAAYDALADADALAIITEWNAYRALDIPRVKDLLKAPVLVDMRNIYDPETMREMGFNYVSIGRPAVGP
ncbi:MAG: UDP-glucose dehydrogenase, partial [Alphaproteobacteria bacterium]|nr:UDP-glucose dehydrogenase [Alphaproteobacteria bacterium]